MKEIQLSREELYLEVWEQPLTALAYKYMRTEMSLRSLCIEMSIPVPRDGHWLKKRQGEQIDTPPLSGNYQGPVTVTLSVREPKKKKEVEVKRVAPELEAFHTVQIKTVESNVVRTDKQSWDKRVVSASQAIRKKDSLGYDGMARSYSAQGEIGICVSAELINRALVFMDSLIKALRSRGHDITVQSNQTMVVVFGQQLKIHCRERTKRIPTNDKWQSHVFKPAGLLVLKLDELYGKEWVDGVTKLIDDQIPSMLDKFEEEAKRQIQWKADCEKSRLESLEKARLQKVLQDNHARELANTRILLQRSIRSDKAVALRKYIDELESRMSEQSPLPDDLQQYLDWARKKADWYDPFINAQDEWLTDTDRHLIEQPAASKSSSFGYEDLGLGNAGYHPGQRWFHS